MFGLWFSGVLPLTEYPTIPLHQESIWLAFWPTFFFPVGCKGVIVGCNTEAEQCCRGWGFPLTLVQNADLSPLSSFSFLIFLSSSLSFSLSFFLPFFSFSLSFSLPFPQPHTGSSHEGFALEEVQALLQASQASEQGTNVGNTNNECWSVAAASLEISKCCS